MSMPTGLFIDAPEMSDASMHQLNQDTNAWPEEVIQKFKERIPRAATLNMMVKFMKKDDENGVATGSIILNSNEKAAVIPIIIKDFMLFPLDVMIASNKLLPLTPDYFDAVFMNNAVFQNLEEYPTYGGLGRFEDANLWNITYPPSLGRYAYASAGYPVLEEISETINPAEFKAYVASQPKVAAMLYKNGHADLVKKVANLRPVNMNEFRQGVDNLIPRGVVMLRWEGPNKYSVLSNSDATFSPALTAMDRGHAMSFVSKMCDHVDDVMNEVDQNGEKMLALPEPLDSVILAKPDVEKPESADAFDHYVVKTKTGVSVEGYVIPHIIDFKQKRVDLKMFIGKTMSTIQPEIWGVRVKNSRFALNGQAPKVGQTGAFVYMPDDSHALATIPVTIQSIVDDGCAVIMKVSDLVGRGFKLKLSNDANLQRIADMGTEYILPNAFKWIPMEGFEPVTNSAADYAVKTAAVRLTNQPVKVISTGYGQYSMKGVDKYASACGWDKTNMQGHQVRFMLTSLGAPQEKIAEAFKIASRTGFCELHGLKEVPLKSEKVAKMLPLARSLAKQASTFKCNLTKAASYIENTQTVDAMLSLNFVSPDNISKFVNKIPQFKAAISNLANCLVASRLGMQEIPEQETASAMYRLIDVVNGLEKLRASNETQGQA